MGRESPQEQVERYSRQQVLPQIGLAGQERLAGAYAAVVGLGALGSGVAGTLVRAGVGRLSLIDRDVLELHNLQRQSLFTEADVEERLPKAEAARSRLQAINSEVALEAHVTDLNPGNAEHLLGATAVIVDGTDNYETRYLINDLSVRLKIPWVYGGVLGTEGLTAAVLPGRTACLRCLFPISPEPGTVPTCETAGVWSPTVQAVAALQSSAALQILMGEDPPVGLVHLDLWGGRILRLEPSERDPECPTCGKGEFDYLRAQAGGIAVRPCGGGSVHVSPAPSVTASGDSSGNRRLDLDRLATDLESQVGSVKVNPYLMQFEAEGCELTVFADGRALIKGTEDPGRARSLYARFVGN